MPSQVVLKYSSSHEQFYGNFVCSFMSSLCLLFKKLVKYNRLYGFCGTFVINYLPSVYLAIHKFIFPEKIELQLSAFHWYSWYSLVSYLDPFLRVYDSIEIQLKFDLSFRANLFSWDACLQPSIHTLVFTSKSKYFAGI